MRLAETTPKSVIPSRDELKALLTVREGDLAQVGFARLLLACAVHERSVVLELRRNALEKQIVLDAGVPVDCRSNVATETLGRFLVSIGRLSEPEYQLALSTSIGRGIPFEEVLADKLPPTEIFRFLQQNLGRKLLDAFTWRSGSYHLSGDVPDVDTPLRVKVPQLIFTGVWKFETQERIDESLEALRGKQLSLAADPLFSLDELRLSPDQNRVIEVLRRGVKSDDLRTEDAAGEELDRLLYAFTQLGIVAVSEVRSRTAPRFELDVPQPVTPVEEEKVPTLEKPVPVEAPSLAATVSKDELMRTYLSFRRKDAFDLLGLEETATVSEIKQAYVRFADTYLPTRFADDSDAMRDKAQEIFLAGARAYAELANPDAREALRAKRETNRQAPKPEPEPLRTLEPAAAATSARGPAIIDPEALYKKGRELLDAGKSREALSYFDMAADCDAQNGTYAAELAWCRYQLMISTATLTMKMLRDAMRIDPRAGAAYLHIGNIHATLGNRLEAEGYLRKAASLMPRDRRPVEALKALLGK